MNRPTPPPPTKPLTKTAPVDKSQTPVPPSAAKPAAPAKPAAKAAPPAEPATAAETSENASSNDDDIAAMLLSLHDDSSSGSLGSAPDVPEGSTIHEMPLPPEVAAQMAAKSEKEKPKSPGNTSSAAKNILEKYMKRPRG